ncbi:MAG: class I SAM-dependent methyltransferase [candidate division WWE3 bacterium]|nr:class I SAM-dependent methyltransferase [candidate division WWE3 bacterium]
MELLCPTTWKDYELLDSGDGYRLERFGRFIVSRPDPTVIWSKSSLSLWEHVDAHFDETSRVWKLNSNLNNWTLTYQNLNFALKPTPFKHLGIFPEQAVNWEFIAKCLSTKKSGAKILNLFGYTGGASLVSASLGAEVTHVDASKPALTWLKENEILSNLPNAPIRLILDDALKFVSREVIRGVKYDGIIMDPPAFGHDPKGRTWKFATDFPELLKESAKLLSDKQLFIIVNSYAAGMPAVSLKNALDEITKNLQGQTEYGELGLKETSTGRLISTGVFSRWSAKS